MSAIWGIASFEIDTFSRNIFKKMSTVMPFSESHSVKTMDFGQVLLGHSTIGTIHKEGFPVESQDGDFTTICGMPVWEGAKSNYEIIGFGCDDRDQDSKILNWALKNDRLSDVGGVYAFSRWDPKAQKMVLGTDRLGFRSLYYYYDVKEKILYFSSRLRGLLVIESLKNDFDFKAIQEFLKFGHSLGNRTFYSQIKLISPGAYLEFDLSAVEEREYWNIGNIPIDHSMSYQDAVELNASALNKSIARRVERCKNLQTHLLLSGGADSRRIAGELSRQGVAFETFTTRGFVEADSEATIAAEVARALGVKNNFIDLPMEGFIQKYWSRANELNDYECCLHQWLLPLAESLPSGSFVNYDGIAGDTLIEGVFRSSGFADTENFKFVNSSDIQTKASKIIGGNLQLSFLKKKIADKFPPEVLISSVIENLTKYDGYENQLTLFFLMNRTRRSISLSSSRILQARIETLYPFLDIDFLNATLSIPYEHRIKHTLRKDIVAFAYPDLSYIPYTQYKSQVRGYSEGMKIAYRREKSFQLRNNINKFVFQKESLFRHNFTSKILLKYLLSYFGFYKPPYELGLTFQVFYEWFAENGYKVSDFR